MSEETKRGSEREPGPSKTNVGRRWILSGMRPTGRLHLGNLVGALQNWVALQSEYESYHFVADWHMLTTDYADTSEFDESLNG